MVSQTAVFLRTVALIAMIISISILTIVVSWVVRAEWQKK